MALFRSRLTSLALAFVSCADATGHVALVDYAPETGNILFRTGNPLNILTLYKDISYNKMTSQFKEAAEKQGIPWPEDFFVQDFSLWTHETNFIASEKNWWDTNPSIGNLTHWPIHGMNQDTILTGCNESGITSCVDSSMQPQTMSASDVKTLGSTYMKWGNRDFLDDRLVTVYNALHTKADKPQILFFHCTCGCDRTGEFYASYAIKYLNKTWTEAMQFDVDLIHRNPEYAYVVGSQWYCEYMSANGMYNHDDCGNCKPFKCKDGILPESS